MKASPPAKLSWWQSPTSLILLAAVIVVGIVAAESAVALAVVLLEGNVALAVLAAAGLAGGWIVRVVGLKDEPWHERLIIGAGLGIGSLSLIVLGLGSIGLLNRPVAFVLAIAMVVLGLTRLALDMHASLANRNDADQGGRRLQPFHWCWLLICAFVAITLLSACLPPGVLFKEEGFGYDVLEYHLAVPKIFFQTGAITFLDNNVYSNMPLNSEMLSLFMMTLRGDPIEACFIATFTNVGLAGLFVAAAWLIGRRVSPLAGVVTGLLAGITPWIAYLAGIAFVEVGMLAMGMCALAAVLKLRDSQNNPGPWALTAGLLAGLACGYKYTAVPLIAIPLALVSLLCLWTPACKNNAPIETHPKPRAGLPGGLSVKSVLIFTLAATATFSPWMIRNLINTHNPVFPLAYSIFGAKEGTWDDTLEARWQLAHSPSGADSLQIPMYFVALQRTVGDFRLGPVVIALAVAGALRRRDRTTLAMLLLLAWQVAVWYTATHLFARFAVVMLLPLIVLASRVVETPRSPGAVRLMCVLLVAGAAWNLYPLASLYYHHTRIGHDAQPINAYAQTGWFVDGKWPGTQHLQVLNALDDGPVMLVGEARSYYLKTPCDYATVFNHHPLGRAVAELPDASAVVDWLKKRGTRRILVNWAEMRRLRRSYGFEPGLDADLFKRLESAGLTITGQFGATEHSQPYATLYEVPQHE